MPSEGPPTAVIFDLDGTLVQTRMASWEVFRGVSDALGLGMTEPEQFFALFDGNFYASLQRICRDEQHAADVKKAMLDALGAHYAPWPVPGIADVVRRLASVSTLAVMSSNATAVIRRILSEHDLALCFSHVFGGDVNESKERGIKQILADASFGPGRRCEGIYDESEIPQPHQPERTVLVTDTVGDVLEAKAAGIRCVGVSWGMHTPQELLDAGAEFVALWPQEILSHLLGPEANRPPQGACAVLAGGACALQKPAPAPRANPTADRAVIARPDAHTKSTEQSGGAGSVPCACGTGHWTTRCAGPCGGNCAGNCGGNCASGGPCCKSMVMSAAGQSQTHEPSSAEDPRAAAAQVRTRRRRGFDATTLQETQSAAPSATSIANRSRADLSAGRGTARELRAAVALTCN